MDISFLKNVVGISKRDCDCMDGTTGVTNHDTSHSGHFSDHPEHGLNLLTVQNSKDCGDNSVWKMLEASRDIGLENLITHFLIESDKVKNTVLNNTTLSIVERDGTYNIDAKEFASLKLYPKVFKGVTMLLRSVDLYIDKVQDYTIKVIKESDGTEVDSQIVSAGNSTKATADFNLRLPLYDANLEPVNYVIYYETNGGRPINHELHCGCANKKYNWENFFNVHGNTQIDLANVLESKGKSNYGYGLRVHAQLECEPLSWLANVDNAFWSNTNFGRVFAMVILNYWTIASVSKILNSEKPSYYSTLKREELYGKRNKAQKIVNDLVPFLAQRMPEELSHCYSCAYNFGMDSMSIITT